MRILTRIGIVITGVLLSGCAGYKIQPVPANSAAWDAAPEGYIIYQPELYFMATISIPPTNSAASGGNATGHEQPASPPNADKSANTNITVTVSPVYLPNPERRYRITTHNFLAKADFAFQFANGWQLSSLSDKSDNTTVANTLAGTLQTAVSAAVKSAGAGGGATVQAVLYKPVYDKDGIIVRFTEVPIFIKKE